MKNMAFFLCVFFFGLGISQEKEWRWQQEVDYTMVIDVDVENHTYKGTQSLVYTNNSPDDLDRVFYHLYFNAFKPGTDLEQNSRYSSDDSRTMSKNILMLDEKDWGDVQNESKEKPAYKKYFMHGTSHHMGLDTHDYGLLDEPMVENMVFTVEPGIYLPDEGFGVRLEDDVIVQNSGDPINLMKDIPIEIEEIEELMNN